MIETDKNLPLFDGISHINIYSKAETELGRLLSNFAYAPFTHPEYGHFNSVEGFWYWLKTDKKVVQLRDLHGFNAKKVGKEQFDILQKINPEYFDNIINEEFINEIKIALRLKLKQNKQILSKLINTNLPLKHYYYYGSKDNAKVIFLPKYDWIVEELELLRKITLEHIKNKEIK